MRTSDRLFEYLEENPHLVFDIKRLDYITRGTRVLVGLEHVRDFSTLVELNVLGENIECLSRSSCPTMPTVQTLTVSCCWFKTYSHCIAFLGCFPALRHLTLRHTRVSQGYEPPAPPAVINLRSFFLDLAYLDFVEFVLLDATTPHLRSTAFSPLAESAGLSALSSLFSKLGDSMEDLSIDMTNFWDFETAVITERLSLGDMRALRTVKFQDDSLRHTRNSAYSWAILCLKQAAESGAMAKVEQISFHFSRLEKEIQGPNELMEWGLLDEVLSRPPFDQLKVVAFCLWREDARLSVKEKLPRLRSKRLLGFWS